MDPVNSNVGGHPMDDESIFADPTPMEMDLGDLGIYNPSNNTYMPATGFNLFEHLRQQAERARLEAEAEALEGEREDEENFEVDETPSPVNVSAQPRPRDQDDPNWFPFPNRTTALCAILMTMPRHPLSNVVLGMIWWWAGQLGLVLPPIAKVKNLLATLHRKTGGQVNEHVSSHKTPFHMNDVSSIIVQEVANPVVMHHLKCYSERNNVVTEMYHASKWHQNPQVKLPWYELDGQLFAEGPELLDNDAGYFLSTNIVINSNDFAEVADLPMNSIQGRFDEENGFISISQVDWHQILQQHPLKERANGHRVIMCPIILFCDDSAGTSSKKWNPFYNWYMQLGGLPFTQSQRDFHTLSLGTSNKASALEMAKAVVESITHKLEVGLWSFDAASMEPVLVTGAVVCIMGDNPMHSELCSTIDFRRGLHFCRVCKVEGKLGNADRLIRFLTPGEPRNWNETRFEIVKQLDNACAGNAAQVRKRQTLKGVKCQLVQVTVEKLLKYAQTHTAEETKDFRDTLGSVEDVMNPLFRVSSFDGHTDLPVEVLHTVLLGIVKWLSRASQKKLSDSQRRELLLRVDALNWQGFQRPFRGKEMIQYGGSLVGKDFRRWIQVAPFAYDGFLSNRWMRAWFCMADVFLLVYVRNIVNMESYICDLQMAMAALIASICDIDITIFSRCKYHALVHLVEDIRRFGPPRVYASEKFESFNPLVRCQLNHTNCHAPSKDVVIRFAQFRTVRHIISGGFWEEISSYINAGRKVLDLFQDDTRAPIYFPPFSGLSSGSQDHQPIAPFTLKVDKEPIPFDATLANQFTAFIPSEQHQFQRWTTATVQPMKTRVRIGDFVGLSNGFFGRVLEILEEIAPTRTGSLTTRFLIENFEISEEIYRACPVITGLDTNAVIVGGDIQCGVNCQHWCSASCISHDAWIHSDEPRYLINVFCEQHEWIRARFPRHYPTLESTDLEKHCREAFDRQSNDLSQQFAQDMGLMEDADVEDDISSIASSSSTNYSFVAEDPSQQPTSSSRPQGRPPGSRNSTYYITFILHCNNGDTMTFSFPVLLTGSIS
ncbi:hypothetical protein DFS34DRAFT_668125 [Phlyctochytrium arcticum]|nr:hypothetical protein DFS34DRAFT_668125 [Phlyctochytrium arcticum]